MSMPSYGDIKGYKSSVENVKSLSVDSPSSGLIVKRKAQASETPKQKAEEKAKVEATKTKSVKVESYNF